MSHTYPELKKVYQIVRKYSSVMKFSHCNSLAEWLIKKSGRIGKGSGRGEVTADEATDVLKGAG